MNAWISLFFLLPSLAAATGRIPVTLQGEKGRQRFQLEYAATEAQKESGLMYRDRLAADGGMYFDYRPGQTAYMWMHQTRIPLDMLFIDRKHRIVFEASARPYDETPVGTPKPVIAVMELPGGTIRALGLAVGQRVTFAEPVAP